jgi:hypothetical protein
VGITISENINQEKREHIMKNKHTLLSKYVRVYSKNEQYMSTETEVHGNVDMTYNNMHHEHFWLYVAA